VLNKQPKKILFVTITLSGGGAERQLQHLLTYLDRRKYSPMLVLLEKTVGYDIPSDVPVICLNKKHPSDFFKLIFQLVKILKKEKPDSVISFLTYSNILLVFAKLMARYNNPVIISERTNLEISLNNVRKSRIKSFMIKKLYPYADKIITVSLGVAKGLCRRFRVPKEKVVTIYNAIDIDKVQRMAEDDPSFEWYQDKAVPVIIAVGSLAKAKAYPDLLAAFSVVRKNVSCRLVILGVGELEQELKQLVDELGVSTDVAFCGFQKNPFSFMAHSKIFVLSSHWEGLSNVIIEAMGCGVPVISTNCCGSNEIITDGVNGLLVPVGDTEVMAKTILKLLKDEPLRNRLAEAGKLRSEDFKVEKMVAGYETIF
jgi:glycosyltransferase involved in cell wall biosynthesis